MYNLDDLEQNLKDLIKELCEIGDTIKKPIRAYKNNSKTLLVKMPKVILLGNVCLYLTIQEIQTLSNVCTSIRNVIYSPVGWKIISRIKSPYPIQVITPKSELQIKLKKAGTQTSDFYYEDFEDEKLIYQERTKFKKILMRKFEDYQQSKEKYEAHCEKLRLENSQIFKMKQQFRFFEAIKDQLQEENKEHKDKLKKISEGFSLKIKQMDQATQCLIQQRIKLQNQKQALASKVREYQNEIQTIKNQSENSKTILKRVKNYLVHNQL